MIFVELLRSVMEVWCGIKIFGLVSVLGLLFGMGIIVFLTLVLMEGSGMILFDLVCVLMEGFGMVRLAYLQELLVIMVGCGINEYMLVSALMVLILLSVNVTKSLYVLLVKFIIPWIINVNVLMEWYLQTVVVGNLLVQMENTGMDLVVYRFNVLH